MIANKLLWVFNSHMTKPTVHFIAPADFFVHTYDNDEEIELAYVYAIDHPKLGATNVRTSMILNLNEDGSFETLNTIYVPIHLDLEPLNQKHNSPITENPTAPV